MSQFLAQYGFYLGIGLCLVMHLFMHKGHGNHHANGEESENHLHSSKQPDEGKIDKLS